MLNWLDAQASTNERFGVQVVSASWTSRQVATRCLTSVQEVITT